MPELQKNDADLTKLNKPLRNGKKRTRYIYHEKFSATIITIFVDRNYVGVVLLLDNGTHNSEQAKLANGTHNSEQR